MGANTKIQWCHHTWNPWRGCTKVSEGCRHCYAESMSKRNLKVLGQWGPNGTRVIASESMWREPVKWNKAAEQAGERHRVFCASLADVFEGEDTMPANCVPIVRAARLRLMETINSTPWLDWLLLTKRPENIMSVVHELSDDLDRTRPLDAGGTDRDRVEGMMHAWLNGRSPGNVWLGVSVEDQKAADERIPHLLKVPAAVRFLSCEPLLGPTDLTLRLPHYKCDAGAWRKLRKGPSPMDGVDCGWRGLSIPKRMGGDTTPLEECICPGCWKQNVDFIFGGVNWVIAGGESGHGARPCNIEWIRSIRDQCKAACVPCFIKQLGARPEIHEGVELKLNDPKGGDPDEWPEDLRVREMPEVPHA